MYRDYFKLKAKPFQLSPDARFFYPSKEHRRALSFLQYGLSQADGFIVITGDVGTGKTTLVQTLLGELSAEDTIVANIVTTQLEEDDLLGLVAMNFGIRVKTPGKAMLLREIETFLMQRGREGKRVLLIVDEAQNLPPKSVEELRMLSNFQMQGRPLLQVFLLGQEEFRSTLLSEGFEQLRQRVIATYHLNPLDSGETRTYIEHRLRLVGWNNDPSFDDGAHQQIYEATNGVPRRINNLCDRILLYAYLEECHRVDAEVVSVVAEEIGTEFLGGDADRSSPQRRQGSARQRNVPASAPAEDTLPPADSSPETRPLETMARIMFDKASVQQRISALERAVDALGHSVEDEMSTLRVLLQELLREVRQKDHDTNGTTPSRRRVP